MIPIARPILGSEEQEAVLRVLASGQLAQGEHVAAFERRFAEVCHVQEAVAISSGRLIPRYWKLLSSPAAKQHLLPKCPARSYPCLIKSPHEIRKRN